MWPLPRLTKNSIQIIVGPEHIACYWITSDTNKHIQIKAKQRFELSVAAEAVVYNPTAIQQSIDSFINTYNLHYSYSHFVIDKPLVNEQLIHHTNSYAHLEDLMNTVPYATHYEYCYVGPDADQSLFYVCSIAQSLLLQLHILHANLPLYMQSIRTPLSIQFDLYKHLHGPQFSQAQLIKAIDREQMQIKNIINNDLFKQYLDTMPNSVNTDLVYALGSFLGSLP